MSGVRGSVSSLTLRYQTSQVALALFGHLDQGFCCAGVVDVFRQSAAALDAGAHVVQWIIAHARRTVQGWSRSPRSQD